MSERGDLRQEIEQTRVELGETVEALAAKADVKARVERAASDAAVEVRTTATRVGRRIVEPPVSWVLVGVGALAALAAIVLVGRRRR